MLATYYIRTNQLVPGAAAYADLVAKHPKSTPLKVAYLRLLILNKDLPKARTIGAELAKTDPSVPEVAVLNGMILLNDGKTNEAFTELQKAAKANPDSLVVKIWLGRAARAKGDMTVAQQSFRDAVKLNPRSLEAQSGLAEVSIDAQGLQRPRTGRRFRDRDQSTTSPLPTSGAAWPRATRKRLTKPTRTSTRLSSSIRKTPPATWNSRSCA